MRLPFEEGERGDAAFIPILGISQDPASSRRVGGIVDMHLLLSLPNVRVDGLTTVPKRWPLLTLNLSASRCLRPHHSQDCHLDIYNFPGVSSPISLLRGHLSPDCPILVMAEGQASRSQDKAGSLLRCQGATQRLLYHLFNILAPIATNRSLDSVISSE
jgi:hypothetical protein